MAAALLIPLLVSGFLFCNLSPQVYYRLHRYEGQYLYLKAAQWGFIFVAASVILVSVALSILGHLFSFKPEAWVVSQIQGWLPASGQQSSDVAAYAWFFVVSVGAFFLALLVGGMLHFVYRSQESKLALLERILSDSPLDARLFTAFTSHKPLLISLDTRKIYVGQIVSLGEPNESEAPAQEITVVPLLSGYRDKDTLDVHLQRDYSVVQSPRYPTDLSLVIKQANIASVSWFDLDTHSAVSRPVDTRQDTLLDIFLRALCSWTSK